MSFLVDTDICSAHLKQKGAVSSRFIQHTGRLHISAITLGELYAWALRAGAPLVRAEGLKEMLTDVHVLAATGEIQARLLDSGRPAPGMDLMIGATALVHNLTLVTHKVRDYANIPDLCVADWLS